MIYLALLVFTTCLMLLASRSFQLRINPASSFFGTWMLQFGLLTLPIYHYYQDEPRWEDAVYISAVLTAAAVGIVLGAKFQRAFFHDSTNGNSAPLRAIALVCFGVLGIIGQLAILIDATALTGMSIYERVLGSAVDAIRQLYFENLEEGRRGPLIWLEALFSPFSYVSLALFFVSERHLGAQPRAARLVTAATFGLICINALFSFGGRFAIALALVLILLARYLSSSRPFPAARNEKSKLGGKWRVILLVSLLVATSWYFAVSFVTKRVGNVDPQLLLELGHRVELQDTARAFAQETDSLGYLFVSLSYFSTPTPTLIRYLHLEDSQLPGPYYGQYSFPIIGRPAVSIVTGRQAEPWSDIRRDVFWALTGSGFAGNVWATGVRDFIVDFGRYGAILALLAFTFFSGAVSAAAEKRNAPLDIKVLACFVIAACAWFSFHTPTFINLFYMPVLLLAVWIAWRIIWRHAARIAQSRLDVSSS